MQMGLFFAAHRASDDVTALLHLVNHPVDESRTVLRALVDKASRPTFRIEARDAPFHVKNVLKARGYRWNADARVWSLEVAEDAFAAEIDWTTEHVYGGRRRPDVKRVTWRDRHACLKHM
jgi:DNA polymerase-3 subunit epsilon